MEKQFKTKKPDIFRFFLFKISATAKELVILHRSCLLFLL